MRTKTRGDRTMSSKDKLRVLVIDDELTQRMLVKEYLEDAGHMVRQAEDGKRGLKMAQATKPDVVLLDLLLPSMDGYALCKALKDDPATGDVPVILVTAAREADVIEKGLAAGADDFVTKPIDWAFLADRVANVVKRARERTEMTRMLNSAEPADQNTEETVLREAEAVIDELKSAHAAELARLSSEHAAAMAAAIDRAQAGFAQELAHEADRQQEAVRDAVLAERTRLENLMSDEATRLARQMREEYQEAMDAQLAAHRQQIEALEAQRAADIESLHDASHRETAALERRWRAEVESMQANSARSGNSDDAARAAWSLAARWAAAQQSLADDLLARARQGSPELAHLGKALHSGFSKFRMLADAMLNREPSESRSIVLADFLAEVKREAAPLAEQRRVHIDIEAPPAAITALGDGRRLRYCALSLVVNAIRFTPAGGHVTLSARQDGQHVRIEVADSGVGMAPAEVQDVTNCLVAPAANPAGKSGLGLPTVMALARQMNGSVEIASGLGTGTRATLLLPVATTAMNDLKVGYLSAG